jgi:hypothetical protein
LSSDWKSDAASPARTGVGSALGTGGVAVEGVCLDRKWEQSLQTSELAPSWNPSQGQDKRPIEAEHERIS